MAAPTDSTATPPVSFPMKLFGVFAVMLALFGFITSAGVYVARGKVRSRLAQLEQTTGRSITIGSLDISLTDGLSIRDLRISKPRSSDLHVRIDEISTDLSVIDLLTGRRRPGRVSVRGLRSHIRATEKGLQGFEDLLIRKRTKTQQKKKSTRPIELTFTNTALTADLSHPLLVTTERVEITAFNGTGLYVSSSNVQFNGAGKLRSRKMETTLKATFSRGASNVLNVSWDKQLLVPVLAGDERLLIASKGLQRNRTHGTTTFFGLGVHSKAGSVKVDQIRLVNEDQNFMPKLNKVDEVSLSGLQAKRAGTTLSAEEADIKFQQGDPRSPTHIAAKNVRIILPQWKAQGTIRKIAMGFVSSPVKAWKEGRVLDAFGAVTIERPTLRMATLDQITKGDSNNPTATNTQPGTPVTTQDKVRRLVKRLQEQIVPRLASLKLKVTNGRATVVDGNQKDVLTLDKVALSFGQSDRDALEIGINAVLKRNTKRTGNFSVTAGLDEAGDLKRLTGFVRGRDVAHVLSGFSDYITVEPEAEMDLSFAYHAPAPDNPVHRLRGKLLFNNFGFEAWRISHVPVRNLEGEITFKSRFDPSKRRATVDVTRLRVGKSELTGALRFAKRQNGKARFKASLSMARQDCSKVAQSIPSAMIPRLHGLKVRGTMQFAARLSVDLHDPKALRLKVDGDMSRCFVDSLGKQIKLAKLKEQTFIHHPVEPKKGRREEISLGPGSTEWVSSRMLPRFVKAAAVVTEDRRYYSHKGIRWDLVARALRLDIRRNRFVYGGSTITQQLVKNLFLTREKTLARKLEELIISWQMEREFSKDDILTMYINVVEYGPNIYGIKKAARFYFAKTPWNLSPLEAAFIMGLKPYPPDGFRQWRRGKLNSWWVKRVAHVLDMMYRREKAITRIELDASPPYQPRFRLPQAPMYSGRKYVAPTAAPGSETRAPDNENTPSLP
jgi:hypothetical protein